MDGDLISRRGLISVAAGAAGLPAARAAHSALSRAGLVQEPLAPASHAPPVVPDGLYNVKSYGATGDGVKDDAPAIVATIAAVPKQGGIIYFPPGVYALNSSLNIHARSDLTFLGAGVSATRLLMNQNGVTILSFTGLCTRIAIRDLWLGAATSFAEGGSISIVGSDEVHSDTFLVENVRLQNTPSPWVSQYLDSSQVRNVRIMQTIPGAFKTAAMFLTACVSDTFTEIVLLSMAGQFASEGIHLDHDCDTIIFINSQALHAGTVGWRCAQTGGRSGPRLCRFTNCYAESCTDAGWSIDAARDVRLSGCHAAVNGGTGFQITNGDSVTITNSLALQNGKHGIAVTGGTGVLLDGNTCSNNSQQANAAFDGISIGQGVSGVRIANNRSGDFVFPLANKQAYGLSVHAVGTDALVIAGNDLRDNGRGALAHPAPGVHTTLMGNVGVSP